jgi:hypothetical protein
MPATQDRALGALSSHFVIFYRDGFLTPTIEESRDAAAACRVDLRTYKDGGGYAPAARYSMESRAVPIRNGVGADRIVCLSGWAQKSGLIVALASELQWTT